MERKKLRWDDMTNLKPEDYVINQHIHKLDQVTVEYEARWGCGRLEKLVSPELNHKWQRQNEKLNNAISQRDHKAVIDLVQGCIRGWAAMEADAISRGHNHNPPEWWDVRHDNGTIYRILKNEPATRAAAEACLKDGAVVYTLREVARILDGLQMVNQVKQAFSGTFIESVKAPCDFDNGGDKLPF